MIESAHVRVIEGGCGLFFPHQTLFRALIASHFGSQELDCHFPAHPLCFGQKGSPCQQSLNLRTRLSAGLAVPVLKPLTRK
jgi:hypothetical protein